MCIRDSPLRIPGATVEYSIDTRNEGNGSPDSGTVIVYDVVPANTIMCVGSPCRGGDPVRFVDGANSSGLSFSYPADVTFSSQVGGGAPFNYTPSPDADGFDPDVKGFRAAPTGVFNSSSGTAPHPSFEMLFRVKVD